MFELELFDKIPMSVYKLIYEQTFEPQRLQSEDDLYFNIIYSKNSSSSIGGR